MNAFWWERIGNTHAVRLTECPVPKLDIVAGDILGIVKLLKQELRPKGEPIVKYSLLYVNTGRTHLLISFSKIL